MRSEFEPKGKHTQKGLTDMRLVPTPERMREILERTDLGNQEFQTRIDAMRSADDAFTKGEIERARRDLSNPTFADHHPKTPLPNPKQ